MNELELLPGVHYVIIKEAVLCWLYAVAHEQVDSSGCMINDAFVSLELIESFYPKEVAELAVEIEWNLKLIHTYKQRSRIVYVYTKHSPAVDL